MNCDILSTWTKRYLKRLGNSFDMSSHTSTFIARRNYPRSQLSSETDQQLTPVSIAFITNATVAIRKGETKENQFQASEEPENSHRSVPGTQERNSSTTNESEFHSDQFRPDHPYPAGSLKSMAHFHQVPLPRRWNFIVRDNSRRDHLPPSATTAAATASPGPFPATIPIG